MGSEVVATKQDCRKLGIVVDDFAGLAGATDFIVSVVDGAMRAADGREVVIILRYPASWYTPRGLLEYSLRGLRLIGRLLRGGRFGKPSSIDSHFSRLIDAGLPDVAVFTIARTPQSLSELCKVERIEVLGLFRSPPSHNMPVPWIGYIFDFQHMYFPEYFSAGEIRSRDRVFRRVLREADSVIVNSVSVKNDVERFGYGSTSRVVALPFSAAPKENWFSGSIDEVRARYGVSDRYFMISNQFWVHKRHEIAYRAFAELLEAAPEVQLVLTGSTHDYRFPRLFQELCDLSLQLGISKNIRVLGLLPKLDQVTLMRGSVAVIQPTAFEGGPGGGSVFDAVALGVPTIVSGIPVNLEISEFVTEYFVPDDVPSLVCCMNRALNRVRTDPNREALMLAGHQRRFKQGQSAWAAADIAVSHRTA
jgi:glycosyltransferase involved in cell wall biosynthesis